MLFEWQIRQLQLKNLFDIVNSLGPNCKIFAPHGSFGDIYFQSAIIKEICQNHARLAVLIDNRYREFASHIFAENLNISTDFKIIALDMSQLNTILSTFNILGEQGNFPIRLLPTLYPGIPECIIHGHLQSVAFLRVIAGSSKSGLLPPIENSSYFRNRAIEYLLSHGLPVGKTVIISADNNTEAEFSENFWRNVVDLIRDNGLVPCLNSAGTVYGGAARLLTNYNLPKLNVLPELIVSIPEAAGFYIGGTSGFTTIQACFNRMGKGIHLINACNSTTLGIPDKAGSNFTQLHQMFRKNQYREEFLGSQKEIVIESEMPTPSLVDELNVFFS
jgi:hypothetical protein